MSNAVANRDNMPVDEWTFDTSHHPATRLTWSWRSWASSPGISPAAARAATSPHLPHAGTKKTQHGRDHDAARRHLRTSMPSRTRARGAAASASCTSTYPANSPARVHSISTDIPGDGLVGTRFQICTPAGRRNQFKVTGMRFSCTATEPFQPFNSDVVSRSARVGSRWTIREPNADHTLVAWHQWSGVAPVRRTRGFRQPGPGGSASPGTAPSSTTSTAAESRWKTS